ncbi:TolC family protein [Granulosicoccaceae sp. 1_MG-2023]|nr:TolC family protein [Granulosicoccaceae sp. 1_MG-2023]
MTTIRFSRLSLACLVSAGLCTVVTPLSAQQGVLLGDVVRDAAWQEETRLAQRLQEVLTNPQQGSALAGYGADALTAITPGQVISGILERNLSLANGRIDRDLAARARDEAKAVFDPVLQLDVGVSLEDSSERTLTGSVLAKVFYPQYTDPETGNLANPGEIILPEEAQQATNVERIIFTNLTEESEIRDDETIYASQEDPNGAQTVLNFTAGISQLTPWGVSYQMSATSTYREVFYDDDGHSFDAPWATELVFDMQVPVLNDVGSDATASLASRLANLEQKRQAWLLESNINGLLMEGISAYLTLLGSAGQLDLALRNQRLSEAQLQVTQRRFNSRTATAYELAQMQGGVSAARVSVAAASAAYVQASANLLALISKDSAGLQNRLLLPQGYRAWLQRSALDSSAQEARDSALANRPVLQAGMVALAQAEMRERNARLQARPDLTLSGGASLEQDASVYGYDSIFSSWANVLEPDSSTLRFGAQYVYSLGNRAAKARSNAATAGREDAALAQDQLRRLVVQEVNNAVNALHSAVQNRRLSAETLAAATAAWDSIARRSANGTATQLEVVQALSELQQARLGELNAQLDVRAAEAALLAAQGIFERRAAGWLARNDFERSRMAMLAASGDLQFFLRAPEDAAQ